MGYRVKRKCIWCGAVKEPYAVRQEGENVLAFLERQLGPLGCCAPDGDGHLWHPLHDVEEEAPKRCQCGGHFTEVTVCGYVICDQCGTEIEYA